ncbi:predicted protein [Histoplasma mississippiense (nom. inval.)]|uniref:predicted protein n=1 Tax=Ajellomyces capsulatus (strain NAm1 / WU24) TaxID=2059318 RepID=UPI000157BD9F|nr:predicted protein [Histoplasma mississippiense (nom. inval.)]EDN06180.1 predicted protein [Histoplasma mississippiense (nom. inval.)]
MLKKGILLGEAQDNVKIGKRDKLKGKIAPLSAGTSNDINNVGHRHHHNPYLKFYNINKPSSDLRDYTYVTPHVNGSLPRLPHHPQTYVGPLDIELNNDQWSSVVGPHPHKNRVMVIHLSTL